MNSLEVLSMRVKLKTIEELIKEKSIHTATDIPDSELCYLPKRFFGKEIEVTCVVYPYAEVYYTKDKKWCFPYNFIAAFID